MTELTKLALNLKDEEIQDMLKEAKDALKKGELGALGKFADMRLMLNNSLFVKNMDPGNHLLGLKIDWGGSEGQIRIPPGGQQHIDNFSFFTLWFIRVHVDPPVRLTNNANNKCFYQVTKLLSNGNNKQMQFINPHFGASEVYPVYPGERLIVVPNSMARFILENDIEMRCIEPPQIPQIGE